MADVSQENKAKAAEAKEAGTVAYKAKQFDTALAKVRTHSSHPVLCVLCVHCRARKIKRAARTASEMGPHLHAGRMQCGSLVVL